MKKNTVKDFLLEHHPELMGELEAYLHKTPANRKRKPRIERGSWEYVCKLMPKLADFAHVQQSNSSVAGFAMKDAKVWYIYRPVEVGKRTAKVGITLIVHSCRCGKECTQVELTPKEHYLEFYTMFDRSSTSCYTPMTNLPNMSFGNGSYKVPIDLKSMRNYIYEFFGV